MNDFQNGNTKVNEILFENIYKTPVDPPGPTDPPEPTDPPGPTDPPKPSEPLDPPVPPTGDNSTTGLYIVLVIFSIIAMILLLTVCMKLKKK